MSSARLRSATHHQAGLLQNRLARLEERRARQTRAAEIAFNLDLVAIVESHSPVILDMVQMALDNDPPSHALALALRKARNPMRVLVVEDPHERPTDAAELLPAHSSLPGLLAATLVPSLAPTNHNEPRREEVGYERAARAMLDCEPGELGREAILTPAVSEPLELDAEEREVLESLLGARLDAAIAAQPEPVYRYPEPGEPAMTLPDGRIVAVGP